VRAPDPRRACCAANATQHAEHDHGQIAREILDHADAVDQEEDERYGKAWRSADAVLSMLERVGSGGSTTPTGGLTSG
jgi:hypothetical protein